MQQISIAACVDGLVKMPDSHPFVMIRLDKKMQVYAHKQMCDSV